MTSGSPVHGVARSAPASAGLSDEARPRGTAVTLAAAGGSAGGTTAMTYDVRVGTSICDSAARTSNSTSAITRLGPTAARMRQTLEGIWVNTMVFTRPKRSASRAATGNDAALSTFDAKKNPLAA